MLQQLPRWATETGRLFVLAVQRTFTSFFLCFLVYVIFFLLLLLLLLMLFFLQLRRQNVKAGETQSKVQRHLNLLYSHFHGSSSTREKSAGLPFLPIVTCKQLSRTTNYEGQGTVICNPSVVGSREAIASLHVGH